MTSDREIVRAVRSGQIGLEDALQLIDDAERRLAELVEACTWAADIDAINHFMVRMHLEYWQSRRLLPCTMEL